MTLDDDNDANSDDSVESKVGTQQFINTPVDAKKTSYKRENEILRKKFNSNK